MNSTQTINSLRHPVKYNHKFILTKQLTSAHVLDENEPKFRTGGLGQLYLRSSRFSCEGEATLRCSVHGRISSCFHMVSDLQKKETPRRFNLTHAK